VTRIVRRAFLDAHGRGRADAREGIDHQRDERAVAQADERRNIDAVEQRARFVGGEDRHLAALHAVLESAHGGGRIERRHAAGGEIIKEMPNGGEMALTLLERGHRNRVYRRVQRRSAS